MEEIRKYILSIVIAAIFISILKCFFRKNSTIASAFGLLTGVFMIVTLLNPISDFNYSVIELFPKDYLQQSQNYISESVLQSRGQMEEIIKEQVESYIKNKAIAMELVLDMEVVLSEDNPPIPWQIHLWGAASPHEREVMDEFISENLAISKERILWN